MKYLFAPWRMDYIGKEKPKGCVFCQLPKFDCCAETLVVYKGTYAFIILNRYPFVSGHVMIVPYRHPADISEITAPEWAEINQLMVLTVKALEQEYKPHGFNIGMNIGQAAGAGIADHVHLHVIPRWSGDANFMTVACGTRVIPEDLVVTYDRMVKAIGSLQIQEG